MSEILNETNTQFVVGTLAIACDENILTKQIANIQITQESLDRYSRTTYELKLAVSWPKLQREFAACTNGGERFFENLELFLTHTDVYRFLIELSYFCLTQGFQGKYLNCPDSIDKYKERCLSILTENNHFSATDDENKHVESSKSEHLFRDQNDA